MGTCWGLLPNEAGCSPRGKLWALSHSGASVWAGVEGGVEVRTVRTVQDCQDQLDRPTWTNRSSKYHGLQTR